MSKTRKPTATTKSSTLNLSKSLHVVPHDNKWIVRTEASYKPSSVHRTQGEAIEAARKVAKSKAGEVIIHGRNGQIRERDSFGNTPLPPREPRKVLYPADARASRPALKKAVAKAKEVLLTFRNDPDAVAHKNSEG